MDDAGLTGLLAATDKPEIGDDFAVRARAWFLEAWNAPLWVKWRTQAKEDLGFYVGGEAQWSKDGSQEDLKGLQTSNRAIVSLNHIAPIVDVLTGFERQNRYDIKAAPKGPEDHEDATLLSWLLKEEQEKADAAVAVSDVFEHGLIAGMWALEVGVDWTNDPVHGEIFLDVLQPGEELIWDPQWSKFDLSDARYMIRYKYAFVKDVIADHPTHAKAIREATEALNLGIGTPGAGQTVPNSTDGRSAGNRDGYGSLASGVVSDAESLGLFYDATEDRVLVLEVWYREYETVWLLSNKATGDVLEVETESIAREMAKSDPDNLSPIARQRRRIKMGVILPATLQMLEEDDTPYDNDQQAYPFVVYLAQRKGDDIYGIVRNLKDPQRVVNKRESQILEILIQHANMRPMAEEGAVKNPEDLINTQSRKPVIYNAGHQPPSWYVAPLGDLFRVLTGEGDRGRMQIREISGINTDLLGIKDSDASGIAIQRRQAQGQVISTRYFDNLKTFKKIMGQRLARRIQQVYTYERTVRLVDEVGKQQFVKINPLEGRGKSRDEFARLQSEDLHGMPPEEIDKRPKVLRDVTALDYDVIITDTPTTPSMRMTSLLALLEIVQKIPAIAPAVLDIIVELTDLPDKARVLDRVRLMMQPQVGSAGPTRPSLPPGTPGQPPVPGGSPGPTPPLPVKPR